MQSSAIPIPTRSSRRPRRWRRAAKRRRASSPAAAHSMKRTPPRAGERVYLATCTAIGGFGAAIQRDDGPVLIGESDAGGGEGVRRRPRARLAGAAGRGRRARRLRGVRAALARAHRARARAARALRQHALTAVERRAGGAGRAARRGRRRQPMADRHADRVHRRGRHSRSARARARFMPQRVARGDFWIWDDGGSRRLRGIQRCRAGIRADRAGLHAARARGRGYATALVAALSRELLARGKRRLFLTTDVANPTSNAIYARIGFRAENDDCGFDFVAPRAA